MVDSFSSKKWDKLVAESSDEEDEQWKRMNDLPADIRLPKATLIAINCDTFSEKVRWTLDNATMPYTDYTYPWGLHFWFGLDYVDPPALEEVDFPLLLLPNEQQVIHGTTCTVLEKICGMSAASCWKLYQHKEAKDFETYYDTTLGRAVATIQYYNIITNTKLKHKHIFGDICLEKHRSIYRIIWPFVLPMLLSQYDAGVTEKVNEAWRIVQQVFDNTSRMLEETGRTKYLLGDTFTAADLSFAVHSLPILLPNEKDGVDEQVFGIPCPHPTEFPEVVYLQIQKLRESKAGKLAFRIYSKKKAPKATYPSRFSKVNNPWWGKYYILYSLTYILGLGSIALLWLMVLFARWYITVSVYVTLVVLFFRCVLLPLRGSPELRKLKGIASIKNNLHRLKKELKDHPFPYTFKARVITPKIEELE